MMEEIRKKERSFGSAESGAQREGDAYRQRPRSSNPRGRRGNSRRTGHLNTERRENPERESGNEAALPGRGERKSRRRPDKFRERRREEARSEEQIREIAEQKLRKSLDERCPETEKAAADSNKGRSEEKIQKPAEENLREEGRAERRNPSRRPRDRREKRESLFPEKKTGHLSEKAESKRKSWSEMNAAELRAENDRLEEEITVSIEKLGDICL